MDRLLYFIQLTNPIHIITSESQVKEAQFILSCKDKTGLSAEKVKHYESVIEACVHPASGDIIPPLARVGAIAPVNIPLILGMLLTPPSNVKMTLFLHWANQSYNSLCNYAHRSAKEFDMDAAGKAYTLAVGSACGFAYGLGKLAERAPPSFQKFAIMIPMLATSAANGANMSFTRYGELLYGTSVTDQEGTDHGLSKKAGVDGIAKTALTRGVLVPCSCLLLPPIMEKGLRSMSLMPKNKVASTVVQCGLIYCAMQFALPAALAVFPSTSKLPVTSLEPQFQGLKDSKNLDIKYLYASKGL